ncbi:hypothetical protein BJ978_002082 [Agromyces terreus]|uniref:DUF2993 domain-containing protein n=1 Tax=Agromyces terreus TaxID=424795 RepID=A0A9X2H1E6_9MICO|nr:DUF2993 domain-containing protein [Agromyces terreus]MCP2371406.1 hypothetical protein [Agromyces terreus]
MSTPSDENRDERADAAEQPPAVEADALATAEGGDPAPREELEQTAVLDDVRSTEVIEPLPGEAGGAAAPVAAEPRRKRRVAPWVIVLTCVVALAAVLVVADLVTRSLLEQRIVDQTEQNLPGGVEGEVTAHIGGFSVLAQLATGSFEQITLDAPELAVNGNPLDAHVVAHGVPVQEGRTIDRVAGTVDIDEASVNAFVDIPGVDGEISLGDDAIGFRMPFEVLGFELSASVTAEAEAAGTSVLLTPVGVELSAGGNDLDLKGFAQQVLGDSPIDVCVAQYLPEGLMVDDIAVTSGHAKIAFAATDVAFEEDSLRTRGTCDAP